MPLQHVQCGVVQESAEGCDEVKQHEPEKLRYSLRQASRPAAQSYYYFDVKAAAAKATHRESVA
eukprot:1895069-Amphidinium_carterae.1